MRDCERGVRVCGHCSIGLTTSLVQTSLLGWQCLPCQVCAMRPGDMTDPEARILMDPGTWHRRTESRLKSCGRGEPPEIGSFQPCGQVMQVAKKNSTSSPYPSVEVLSKP